MDQQKSDKKRSSRKLVSHFKSLLLVALSGYFIFNIATEIMTTKDLQADLATAQLLAEEIQNETELLEEQKLKLQNPEYAKRYARGKYLITGEGEQVFSIGE